jgi:hypothetical protein
MSNRHEAEARTIHPRALTELGEEACIVALGVARDLRSGVIPAKKYDQREWCGTAYCIAGHIATRMGVARRTMDTGDGIRVFRWAMSLSCSSDGLSNLFGGRHPSDPHRAAEAIERYVYLGSETPWTP